MPSNQEKFFAIASAQEPRSKTPFVISGIVLLLLTAGAAVYFFKIKPTSAPLTATQERELPTPQHKPELPAEEVTSKPLPAETSTVPARSVADKRTRVNSDKKPTVSTPPSFVQEPQPVDPASQFESLVKRLQTNFDLGKGVEGKYTVYDWSYTPVKEKSQKAIFSYKMKTAIKYDVVQTNSVLSPFSGTMLFTCCPLINGKPQEMRDWRLNFIYRRKSGWELASAEYYNKRTYVNKIAEEAAKGVLKDLGIADDDSKWLSVSVDAEKYITNILAEPEP